MMDLENLKTKKIGVLCGGISSEREISLMSGKAVCEALKKMKFKTVLIDVDKNIAEKIKKEKIDIAYLALHGKNGMLEIMGIPYTGCGVFSSAASMDKVISKKMFEYAKIPTPKWMIIDKDEIQDCQKNCSAVTEIFDCKDFLKTDFPVVVKPATQGSAIGISIAKNKKEFEKAFDEAAKYDRYILIEQYIKGTEVTAGVLNGRALPVIEIVPKGKFYDFKSKYTVGQSRHIIPARLPEKTLKEIQKIAVKIYNEFRCKGTCRADMIVDKDNKIYVLELNTLPGMTETSLFPDAAKYEGMSFEDLVLEILKNC